MTGSKVTDPDTIQTEAKKKVRKVMAIFKIWVCHGQE
jgi:hypothetical protein